MYNSLMSVMMKVIFCMKLTYQIVWMHQEFHKGQEWFHYGTTIYFKMLNRC